MEATPPLRRVGLKSEKELLKMVNICNASRSIYKSSSKSRFWQHINTELQKELRKPKQFTNCRGKMTELVRQRKTKEKGALWMNTTSESEMNDALDRWIRFIDGEEANRGSIDTPERTAEAQLEEEMGAEDQLLRALEADSNRTEPQTGDAPNSEQPNGANDPNNPITIDDNDEGSRRTSNGNEHQSYKPPNSQSAPYESQSFPSVNPPPMHPPPPRPPPPATRTPRSHKQGDITNEILFREMMEHLRDDGKAWREYMTWREYMMTSREQMATGAQNMQNAILQEVQSLRQQLGEDTRARENQRATNLNLLNQMAEVAKAQDLQQRAINQALASINSTLAEMKSRQEVEEEDEAGMDDDE